MNVPKFSRVFTESEYEEIGPPRHRPGGVQHPCDLCGSPNALLSCAQCHNQAFCAACDDMYHKHPKRTDHVRKSLKNAPAHTGPAVEMPGSGPKAPPRRNTRRSGGLSAEPSPAPSRTASRSGTLQRQPSLPASIQPVSLQPVTQPGHPMAGRPLPPPPPVPVQTGTPPPILPKKSASLAQMSTLNRPRPTPQSIPMPGAGRPTATGGVGGAGEPSRTGSTREQWTSPNMAYPKKISNSSQYPSMYPAQGSMYPKSSNGYSSNNNGYPSNNNIYPNKASGYPGGRIYPQTKYPLNQQYPLTSASPSYPTAQQITSAAYPGSSLQLAGFPAQTGYPSFGGNLDMPRGEVPPGGNGDWNGNGWTAGGPSNYHEDISFPSQPSEDYPPGGAGAKGSRRSSRGVTKGRFANRVNRSSSLHDLARARLDPSMESSEGVRWRDEMSNVPGYPNPSLGFQRATSTKSLHMLGGGGGDGRLWNNNNNNMWSNNNLPFNIQHGQFPPIVPGWGGMPGMPGMLGVGGVSLNRSMHELNKAYLRSSSPSESQKSSRSKKSNRSNKSGNSRRSKSIRHKERTRHNSSSQSRNASRNASRNSKKTRGDRDRSASTDSEDFFTGESDEEFVSLSSHSDKSPRVSWTCEHCTYMNNPGVRVCTMCSRTTKLALRDEKPGKKEKVRKPRKKFDSSDSEVERKEKRREEVGKKERRRDEGEKKEKRREKKNYSESESEEEKGKRRREKEKEKKGKKKLSESNESDIDDAIATYYAVRMDKNKGMSMNPVYADSSSESTGNVKSTKRPNPDAPAPAKGILKKASSNPSLNKLEAGSEMGGPMSEAGGTISEVGYITNKLTERLKARGALMSPKPKEESRWVEENWTRQKEELKAWAQNQGNQSYRSEHIPQHGHLDSGVEDRLDGRMEGYLEGRLDERMEGRMEGKMYRTLSGHSLAEPELMAQNFARRGSEQVNGKRNFRSKRFSRNLEPSLKRAQSFHMDQRLDGENWMDQQRRTFYRANSKNSINSEHMGGPAESYLAGQTDSSDVEEPVTFMSTVTSSTRGPGGIGSYLSRREFGSNEVQPGPDSGYVSHSSGGGYPKLQVQNKNTIKSFTLSMDRGFLGAPPPNLKSGMSGSISDFARFRSMEDLTVGKKESNSSIQLVQILRDAEEFGFSSIDIQVAAVHCGAGNPVDWLNENWGNMIETVMTLASNVGHEAEENTVGTISKLEAREALRANKGNIWVAVTDCVETRQKKYDDLMSRGKFSREDVVTMLTAHQGDTEAAFQELNKSQLKTFLQRIRAGPQEAPTNQEELEDFEDATSEAEIEEPEHKAEVDQEEEEEKVVQQIVHEVVSPEQLQLERQVRRLLAEQKVKSFQQGEIILRLIDEGFPEDECLLAAEQASKAADTEGTAEDLNAVADFNTALNLLKRDCELCATQMNIKQVVRMVACEHCCCSTCATNFFSILIKDKNISQAVCPFCAEPSDLQDDDVALEYFAKLDILLKVILEKDIHDLFQRKLRDRTLAKDPNFKWCYKCPFGFLADPKNKKLVCPDCRAMSCAKCLAPWEPTHEGITCQDFARWKEENDPDHQAAGLEQHLAQHGISCPACNFRYTLTKGGCMHFTCTQCKFEFCIGCKRPFKLGTRCGKDPGCAKLGLHAHHPRNCLFYLRDKEPEDLRKLLKKNKVEFDATGEAVECGVQVQKESDAGLQDGVCGEMAEKGHAGLCRIHYVEYLCEKIVENKLEVVSLLELGEVKAVFSRAGKFLPKQRPGEYEFQYLRRLIQVVQEEIPLETA